MNITTDGVEPDAWVSIDRTVGLNIKDRYGKLPIQSTNPFRFEYKKLYLEKTVIGLMKAAYYDGYSDREQEQREINAIAVEALIEIGQHEQSGVLSDTNPAQVVEDALSKIKKIGG